MIADLYISKSFCMLGDTLNKCFDCSYCRHQDHGEFHYHKLPIEISPVLAKIPVVINCFYGDPLLQWDNTKNILARLSEARHTGPVIIITKGYLRYALTDLNQFDRLDIHVALSTTGKESGHDKVSWKTFQDNVRYLNKAKNVRYSCEFRPVMYGVNDDKDTIENLMKICGDYGLPVGYSGLQGDALTQEFWKREGIDLKPYPGYKFNVKKPISDVKTSLIKEAAVKNNVNIFKKTSCLISYVHEMERDYNAHYYRPNEMLCSECVMHSKCSTFKATLDRVTHLWASEIPFEFRIEHRDKHKCMLHDTCPHPHPDCTKINGKLLVIKEPLTTADVRIIKWLTGFTVAANFTESNFISDKWWQFRRKGLSMADAFLRSYGGEAYQNGTIRLS